MDLRFLAVVPVVALFAGCPAKQYTRTYPPPAAADVVGHIEGLRERAATLNADTKTDVRLGKDRVNVTVLMLAAWGGKLRFLAQDPNSATAAELASDGARYCFLDVHANCGECGPATPEAVASLVRIPLEPDQVVSVLLGVAPLLPGAESSVEWQSAGGREILTQKLGDETRRVVLDGRDKRWDVLEAEARAGGKVQWTLRHKDFHEVKTKDGKVVRLPGASLFEQGGDTVRIEWRDQVVGEPLPDAKFQMTVPPGLPMCGAAP